MIKDIVNEPDYSVGFNRILKKSQIINAFSIGPCCFAIPSGMYTATTPLNQILTEYENPRFDAIIDIFEIMGVGFEGGNLAKLGFMVRKGSTNYQNGDSFLPNIMTKVNFYPGTTFANWINPPPTWTNCIGYDIKLVNGDVLRSYIYNETGKLGYIYIKYFGHYEKKEIEGAI